MQTFDIMIVYDAAWAHSAADLRYVEPAPFSSKEEYASCNTAYQYLMEYCLTKNLTVAFTTTTDVLAAGHFNSVWTCTQGWQRQPNVVTAKVVFDKFSNLLPHNRAAYRLLTACFKPKAFFYNQVLRAVFDNKLETYVQFPAFAIPTVKLDSLAKIDIQSAKVALQTQCDDHRWSADFNEQLVVKDQFGIGGTNIFKITCDADFAQVDISNHATRYVVQPLIQAGGFKIADRTGNSDLRVILCENEIIQSYLRVAKAGEFRSNAHQGAEVVYLNLDQIPSDVIEMIDNIKLRLPTQAAPYTLDFIKSTSGHLYFIEGNNSPGIIWFDAADEIRAKELIHLIVKKLQLLV